MSCARQSLDGADLVNSQQWRPLLAYMADDWMGRRTRDPCLDHIGPVANHRNRYPGRDDKETGAVIGRCWMKSKTRATQIQSSRSKELIRASRIHGSHGYEARLVSFPTNRESEDDLVRAPSRRRLPAFRIIAVTMAVSAVAFGLFTTVFGIVSEAQEVHAFHNAVVAALLLVISTPPAIAAARAPERAAGPLLQLVTVGVAGLITMVFGLRLDVLTLPFIVFVAVLVALRVPRGRMLAQGRPSPALVVPGCRRGCAPGRICPGPGRATAPRHLQRARRVQSLGRGVLLRARRPAAESSDRTASSLVQAIGLVRGDCPRYSRRCVPRPRELRVRPRYSVGLGCPRLPATRPSSTRWSQCGRSSRADAWLGSWPIPSTSSSRPRATVSALCGGNACCCSRPCVAPDFPYVRVIPELSKAP
jgi:hypothetical protein